MERLLRDWRQDAVNKHQYESAIYIGDKLLALTGDPQDAFWLAQVHFSTGNYTRAQSFLARHDLLDHSPACRYLAAHCHIKQGKYDEALQVLGETNPTHLIANAHGRRKIGHARGGSQQTARSEGNQIPHLTVVANPRNGSTTTGQQRSGSSTTGGQRNGSTAVSGSRDAHSAIARNQRSDSAATMVRNGQGESLHPGKKARPDRIEKSEEREHADHANLKFEAAMCYLRGLCYAKQNAFDRAKQCYQDAVRIDVQCFEAFDQLMKNCLLSPQEEWDFLESLDFDSIPLHGTSENTAQEAAAFVRMLYTTRLSKYKNPEEFSSALDTLSTHYRLSANHDIVLAKSDLLFTQCRFHAALELTSSVLESDPYNFAVYPTHLACLYELGHNNALFLLAHRLADSHPDEPCTWLAVGVYYLATHKIAEARRFFSKASMMDPHFGPAWIGFAHTFAAEGEHDQAISAYSTASRLFQGTHLPTLYLGMQNLQLNNLSLAHEYLREASDMCPGDPLLLNEMGVVMYHLDQLDSAIEFFQNALAMAEEVHAEPRAWIGTRSNLGHALRRKGQFAEALAQFETVLRLGGREAGVFCAKGLVLLEMNQAWAAVAAFHEALAVSSQDPVATDLLSRALEEMATSGNSIGGGGGWDGEGGAVGGGSAVTSFTSTVSDSQIPTEFGALGGMDASGRRAAGIGSSLGHAEVDEVLRTQLRGAVKERGGRRARRMQMQGQGQGTWLDSHGGDGAGDPGGAETSLMEMSDDD